LQIIIEDTQFYDKSYEVRNLIQNLKYLCKKDVTCENYGKAILRVIMNLTTTSTCGIAKFDLSKQQSS